MLTPGAPAPAVVIVAYRADDHLARCLERLGTSAPVVVVDNGGTARAIAERAGADYVAAPGNVGFAAGVNLGLRRCPPGADVLLLNPDARLDADGLAALHEALHAPGGRRAAVGPRLVDAQGRPQAADWPMPSPATVWLDALGLARWWRGRRFVVGAVLLLAGAALAELGGLDERYFLYAEEADWQQRAQRAGWTVAVVPGVVAEHAGSASSGDPAARLQVFRASAHAFAQRWYGRRGAALMRAGELVATARRAVTSRVRRSR